MRILARRATRASIAAVALAAVAAVALPATATIASASTEPLPNEWEYRPAAHQHLVDSGLAVEANDRMLFTIDGEAVADMAAGLDTAGDRRDDYNRNLFDGGGWKDFDGDGVNTRNDILLRDLTETVPHTDGKQVGAGKLFDPYTGTSVDFQHTNYPTSGAGNSNAVPIDHIVSLSAAWTGGAHEWDRETRERFSNDPANLIATTQSVNSSKSDLMPSAWMPPNEDYHCTYIAQVTYIADEYDIAIADADKDTIVETADNCELAAWATIVPEEPAQTGTPGTTPAPTETDRPAYTEPVVTPAPEPTETDAPTTEPTETDTATPEPTEAEATAAEAGAELVIPGSTADTTAAPAEAADQNGALASTGQDAIAPVATLAGLLLAVAGAALMLSRRLNRASAED